MNIDEPKFCYRYFHPAVAADCVIFGFDGKGIKILLIERGQQPYLGMWALPGGFMKEGESIEDTAIRELQEETNLSEVVMYQFRVFSQPRRDPREQVVTVAFIALVRPNDYRVVAGDDAARARWFDETELPPLAFDHAHIIREAREYLREMLRIKPVAFGLLDEKFSMSELQNLYEAVNGVTYDRRNFLRTALESEIITEAHSDSSRTPGRARKLYEAAIPRSHDNPAHFSDGEVPLGAFSNSHSPANCMEDYSEGETTKMSEPLTEEKPAKKKNASPKGLFSFFTKQVH